MDFDSIRLGNEYWCVFKVSVVDPEKKEHPEFLMHIAKGRVMSKGDQLNDDGSIVRFVEVAGQRIKHDHVFESPEDAIDKLEAMMSSMADGLRGQTSE